MIYFCRWQARREHDRNMRAGLIPSRALQERRIVHERNEIQNGGTGTDGSNFMAAAAAAATKQDGNSLTSIDLYRLDFHPPHPPALVCAASLKSLCISLCIFSRNAGARKKEGVERNSCFHKLLPSQGGWLSAYALRK